MSQLLLNKSNTLYYRMCAHPLRYMSYGDIAAPQVGIGDA